VDSLDELEQVEAAAARLKKTARISFRINPGVDPHTIHQINTGVSESKFGLHLEGGIALSAYERAKALPHVKIAGAHCHIGSQITETEGYEITARKMLAFLLELKEKLGLTLEFLDLGGGLGIPYRDGQTVMSPDDLARALKPIWDEGVAKLGYEPTLWLEPGRFFVAQSGFLLTRVNTVKTTPLKTFVNVDAGFNTLMRPAMYQAYHRARVVGRTEDPLLLDVAGDVCETGDILAAERTLPRPRPGDLVALLDAGAYGFSMASEYNARPLPAEVLVDGDHVTVIRQRGSLDDLYRRQLVPKTIPRAPAARPKAGSRPPAPASRPAASPTGPS
jgi:diaminopimelate decarboxylase